ncbi:hypothetical protein CCR75_006962 [Bremia lactucae]|uniref:DIRP domain-containing protein n=1 Tax=Bremia lactucae TaxID=4779 RepID=A0A976FLT0_BRELC|nr:hypothetical protein CCR75_006962 [Bremia lactucae]
MLPYERVLGPSWSLVELRKFYVLLKVHGRQWDTIADSLPLRSAAMVRGLFEMHRRYLSLPEASVEGFCAIMMDHFEMQNELLKRNSMKSSWVKEVIVMNVKQAIGDGLKLTARSRKKRRLENLMSTEHLATLQSQKELDQLYCEQRSLSHKKRGRKQRHPMKAIMWLEYGQKLIHGARFRLPWYHWFHSFSDVDFFQENEFVGCLKSMGLEKTKVATRSIWSSMRASMGRPRRLSPLYFAQEKQKLQLFRNSNYARDPAQLTNDRTNLLKPGVPLIVWMESKRCFRRATFATFHARDQTCQVFLNNFEAVSCKLEHIMVLDFSPWSNSEDGNTESKVPVSTLYRRREKFHGDRLANASSTISDDRYREEKIRVMLTVKSLLYRKEKIISALSTFHKRINEQQAQLSEKNATKSSPWTTPTALSPAIVKDFVKNASSDKALVQKQHSWLIANLEDTNASLQAALLSLQSFSAQTSLKSGNFITGLDDNILPIETLSEDQMRWAIHFLSASQQKAAAVVAEAALQIEKEGNVLTKHDYFSNAAHSGKILPNSRQLVANCVTLMSVLHCHVAASPDVPHVVTQKLVERVLELLKPKHESNMDLYTELCAAAKATQDQMTLQAALYKN